MSLWDMIIFFSRNMAQKQGGVSTKKRKKKRLLRSVADKKKF